MILRFQKQKIGKNLMEYTIPGHILAPFAPVFKQTRMFNKKAVSFIYEYSWYSTFIHKLRNNL